MNGQIFYWWKCKGLFTQYFSNSGRNLISFFSSIFVWFGWMLLVVTFNAFFTSSMVIPPSIFCLAVSMRYLEGFRPSTCYKPIVVFHTFAFSALLGSPCLKYSSKISIIYFIRVIFRYCLYYFLMLITFQTGMMHTILFLQRMNLPI